MSEQQTVLRVKTNYDSDIIVTGTTGLTVTVSTTGFTYSGTGSVDDPYVGLFPGSASNTQITTLTDGVLYYNIDVGQSYGIGQNFLSVYVRHAGESSFEEVFIKSNER